MLEYDTETNQIINLKPDELKDVNPDTDFLILKTGFGKYRGKKNIGKIIQAFLQTLLQF